MPEDSYTLWKALPRYHAVMLLPEKYVSYHWTRETPRFVEVVVAVVDYRWSSRPRQSPHRFEMKPPTTTKVGLGLRMFGEKRGWYRPMEMGEEVPN